MIKDFDNFISTELLYFLLESRGISDSTIEIRDNLKKDISSFINKTKNDKFFKLPMFQKSIQIIINSDSDFKIKNCVLNIKIKRYKENSCNGKVDVEHSKIINGYIENSIIELDIYFDKFDEDFIFKIYSVLLHELVHLYEHYNILLNKKFRPHYWSIGSIYKSLRDNYKNDDVLYILELLYKSLRNEIASNLHQYYDYKKHKKTYNKLNDIINDLSNFNINNISITNDFIKELNSVRNDIYNSIKKYTINKYYLKDLNNSLWKNDIDQNNIINFLSELKLIFDNSVDYINKKLILITNKLNEIRYDDYKGTLHESVVIGSERTREYEVLFF